jgi:hypothetical protein
MTPKYSLWLERDVVSLTSESVQEKRVFFQLSYFYSFVIHI